MNTVRVVREHIVIEGILDDWHNVLGKDFNRYRNHVYRVFNLCMHFNQYRPEDENLIAIASCFHDLAIWSKKTFDYLELSVDEMKEYIAAQGVGADLDIIALMIRYHHKLRPYQGEHERLVENFRKADMTDVTQGRVRFGLRQESIILLRDTFPYYRFHGMLKLMSIRNFFKNPFRPLPMLKW